MAITITTRSPPESAALSIDVHPSRLNSQVAWSKAPFVVTQVGNGHRPPTLHLVMVEPRVPLLKAHPAPPTKLVYVCHNSVPRPNSLSPLVPRGLNYCSLNVTRVIGSQRLPIFTKGSPAFHISNYLLVVFQPNEASLCCLCVSIKLCKLS